MLEMRITFILLIYFLQSFSMAFSQPCCKEDFLKYPLKSISTFCQNKPETPISKVILTYDKENHLIKYSSFKNNIETNRIVFLYNDLGLLTSKEFYSFDQTQTLDRIRLFKYDEKNQLIYEGYDDERGNNTKNNYLYNKNGQLIESTVDCNYTHLSYSYEYDSQKRISKKYKNNELEISYEYSNNLLIKKIHYNRNNDVEIMYEYDDNGLLINKKENGKTIEKNIYYTYRLIERWTYYFGIDPCYSPCCSQYLIKYEYY